MNSPGGDEDQPQSDRRGPHARVRGRRVMPTSSSGARAMSGTSRPRSAT